MLAALEHVSEGRCRVPRRLRMELDEEKRLTKIREAVRVD
jgi:hypothetical protein